MRKSHGPIIPVKRHPRIRTAQIVETSHANHRRATVPDIARVVGSRDLKHVQSDVLPEVRRRALLTHAGKAQTPVSDEGGRKAPGLADRRRLYEHVGVAVASCRAWSADGPVVPARNRGERHHSTVFGPDHVLVGPVPVEFQVNVVAVEPLRRVEEEVLSRNPLGVECPQPLRNVRLWPEPQNRPCRGIKEVRRHHIKLAHRGGRCSCGIHGAPRSVRVPRLRVENHPLL